MEFFAAFDLWLQAQLATYISERTAQLAALTEPFVAACAVLYVLVWGWLQLTGRIEQPVIEGAKRIVVLAVVLGLSVGLWSYNAMFVDTFIEGPRTIARALAAGGVASTIGIADTVLTEGITVGENLFKQAGVIDGNFGFYLAALLVYGVVIVTAGYAAFLDALARIALTVILALGPLFLAALLFDSTRRFFEAWVAQLANYGLVAILTGAVAGLLMQVIRTEATEMAALGTGIEIAQVVPLVVACVLILLVMRQVMPIAAGLASGVALASSGVIGVALAWTLGRTARFARGTTDSQTSRWDPMSRRLGYYAGMPARAAISRSAGLARSAAASSLRPRNEIRRAPPK